MKKLSTILYTALIAAALNQTANADELLPPGIYGNELDRCISEIRSALGTTTASAIRHDITGIEKQGAWYSFDITTARIIDADTTEDIATTECRAHRFNDRTKAQIQQLEQTEIVADNEL